MDSELIMEEEKNVIASCRSGIGKDQIYVLSLWYYRMFNFLGDQMAPRNSSSNLNYEMVSFMI